MYREGVYRYQPPRKNLENHVTFLFYIVTFVHSECFRPNKHKLNESIIHLIEYNKFFGFISVN